MNTIQDAVKQATKSNGTHNTTEGTTTKKIEQVTAAIPSSTWLLLAGGALVGSLALKIFGRNAAANFVGQWVPTILLLGVYNKIVKTAGSDQRDHAQH